MNLQERIGQAIVQLRKQKNLSQEQLALQADIDRRYMSDIENGKRNVSLDVLSKIAKYFDWRLSEFLSYAETIDQMEDDNKQLKQWLCERGSDETVLFENPPYRHAVVGISQDDRLIYSERKILEYLILEEGLSVEDAYEELSYNIIRSLPYMGEKAPIIMSEII